MMMMMIDDDADDDDKPKKLLNINLQPCTYRPLLDPFPSSPTNGCTKDDDHDEEDDPDAAKQRQHRLRPHLSLFLK